MLLPDIAAGDSSWKGGKGIGIRALTRQDDVRVAREEDLSAGIEFASGK